MYITWRVLKTYIIIEKVQIIYLKPFVCVKNQVYMIENNLFMRCIQFK